MPKPDGNASSKARDAPDAAHLDFVVTIVGRLPSAGGILIAA
jgi:hypothetical protein